MEPLAMNDDEQNPQPTVDPKTEAKSAASVPDETPSPSPHSEHPEEQTAESSGSALTFDESIQIGFEHAPSLSLD